MKKIALITMALMSISHVSVRLSAADMCADQAAGESMCTNNYTKENVNWNTATGECINTESGEVNFSCKNLVNPSTATPESNAILQSNANK